MPISTYIVVYEGGGLKVDDLSLRGEDERDDKSVECECFSEDED